MDLSIHEPDGQGVVALRGEFNLADAPAVTSHLITAAAACGPLVIVDLAALEGIGFAGLSVLLRIRKWTRRNGGDLRLAAPQPAVRQVLQATGLIDVFSVYRNVDEAASGARGSQPLASPPARPAMGSRSELRPPACRGSCRAPGRPRYRGGRCRLWHTSRASCLYRG